METSKTVTMQLDRVVASQFRGKHVATGLTSQGHILLVEQLNDDKRKRPVLHVHRIHDQWRTTIIIAQEQVDFSYVGSFADGRILLVASRCDDDVDGSWLPNAFIYDQVGHLLDSFCLDDGIQNVQVDEIDQIWVSYFDEGIYADAATNTFGSFGLVAFNDQGKAVFKNNDYPIDDCYALNVIGADDVWFFYYSDYRIVHLHGGVSQAFAAPKRAFSDFSVYKDYLVSTDNEHTFVLQQQGKRYIEQGRMTFISEQNERLTGTIKMRNNQIVLTTEDRLYTGKLSDLIFETE
ncbi:hypothetical protein [Exiguobacterium oxidotolerans]|uniref:Uncharacterized protein n=1 Tax=Exiguobacterium oxidotolerans TaxID=223958 RepID=A0A653I299_9BACL|nr:hypothetical protein [Exiguobacterium oxidotolerans]VWX33029.1 conserved hypothetical protein [Exiguobacterium oxidotolerans]